MGWGNMIWRLSRKDMSRQLNLKVDYEITGLAVLSFVVGCLHGYIAALVE